MWASHSYREVALHVQGAVHYHGSLSQVHKRHDPVIIVNIHIGTTMMQCKRSKSSRRFEEFLAGCLVSTKAGSITSVSCWMLAMHSSELMA
jgi:hypothetical protein